MLDYEYIKNYEIYEHKDILADFLKQTYNTKRVELKIEENLEIEIHGLVKFVDSDFFGFRITIFMETTFEDLKNKIDRFIISAFKRYQGGIDNDFRELS